MEFTPSTSGSGSPAAGCEVLARSLRESCFGPLSNGGQLATGTGAVLGSASSSSGTVAMAVVGVVVVVGVAAFFAVRSSRSKQGHHDFAPRDTDEGKFTWQHLTQRASSSQGAADGGAKIHAATELEWDGAM
jgi:hypothetical protein